MRIAISVLAVLLSTIATQAAILVPVIISPAFLTPPRIFPEKFVGSGGHVTLWEVTALNPDCSSNGPVTFKIIKSPTHGDMNIASTGVFPTYPPNNLRHVCNSRRVPGQRVSYTSRAGYSGMDLVEFETIYPAGMAFIT